jgi:putative phosphoesterase
VKESRTRNLIRIGVLSDTHIPDRVGDLHPDVLPFFKKRQVDLIIHAGDISIPDVLRRLEEIAPVHAVRGNRDWWRIKQLPATKEIRLNEVKILITHGYGNLYSYFWDKIPYWFTGYRYERFIKKFSKLDQEFDVIIFGHSHRPENRWEEGKLYFNPGSAYDQVQNHLGPSIGLIEIDDKQSIQSEIIYLTPMRWRNNRWVENKKT